MLDTSNCDVIVIQARLKEVVGLEGMVQVICGWQQDIESCMQEENKALHELVDLLQTDLVAVEERLEAAKEDSSLV